MKKPLLVILLVVIVVSLIYFIFFANGSGDVKNYPSAGNRIVAFGDSLVEGIGANPGSDFVSQLSQRSGIPIENYGHAGDTTEQALERLPVVLEEVPYPKIAIVLLGGNDFLRKIPKEETFTNLSLIIESFQNHGAVVLLLGIRGGIFKDNFESEFEELHKMYKTAYISNVLHGLITNRKLMYDSIHPNDAGYERIAERIYPILKKISQ